MKRHNRRACAITEWRDMYGKPTPAATLQRKIDIIFRYADTFGSNL